MDITCETVNGFSCVPGVSGSSPSILNSDAVPLFPVIPYVPMNFSKLPRTHICFPRLAALSRRLPACWNFESAVRATTRHSFISLVSAVLPITRVLASTVGAVHSTSSFVATASRPGATAPTIYPVTQPEVIFSADSLAITSSMEYGLASVPGVRVGLPKFMQPA